MCYCKTLKRFDFKSDTLGHCAHTKSTYSTNLKESYLRIGRALAGGNLESIILNHSDLNHIVMKVTDMLDTECSVLCRKEASGMSLFPKMTFDQMSQFTWSVLVDELQRKAPQFFSNCRTQLSVTVIRGINSSMVLPTIQQYAATILKERNREMVGLQTIVSLMLLKSCAKNRYIMQHNKYRTM